MPSFRRSLDRYLGRYAGLALLLVLAGGAALLEGRPGASDIRDSATRDFDFYVLALSWSPSYCEVEGGRANREQCGSGADFAFVVHGLWPQFERGFPTHCAGQRAEPSRALISAMMDIMPSRGLINHQWDKHGTCSGLSPQGYFDTTRQALARVSIPATLRRADTSRDTSPSAIESAFLKANPGMPAEGIAVTCDNRRLREVRVCLTTDLAFRACPEVDRQGCRRNRLSLPAARP